MNDSKNQGRQARPVPRKRGAPAILYTDSGAHRLWLRVADGPISRFLGLMMQASLPDDEALLITSCRSVHGMFMRFAIDLVYLDLNGWVTKCVRQLKPWRASWSGIDRDRKGRGQLRAAHTLELPEGAIDRYAIAPGNRLECRLWQDVTRPYWVPMPAPRSDGPRSTDMSKERGASMVEFTLMAPLITLLALSIVQYGMLFFAKNQINHAAFMAARAGATNHAHLDSISNAYARAMAPLYATGTASGDLPVAVARAQTDMQGMVRIELLNPTKESFDDWSEPALQSYLHTGARRVIPNSGQAFKDHSIRSASGQTIQDANLIKLRVTHGYQPKIPLVDKLYKFAQERFDPKDDSFHTKLIEAGRIPIVTNVTLHMQSHAIEPDSPISTPGLGNNGSPTNPGEPPTVPGEPPNCNTIGCSRVERPKPPPCNPATDPNQCRPLGCTEGNPSCDPGCGVLYCCAQK